MALDTVPWFIGGGAEHSPAVARMLAYAATNGNTGINSPADLKVTALPTPGASVRIMPGGASLVNLYPGGSQQSYTVRNASATDVAISATGSSGGSTRYVIIRIDDPEFGGAVPANVKTGPYVRPVLVNSITNLAYPFIALAKITQPANTATITQAMITDIRRLANPHSATQQILVNASVLNLTSTSPVTWPAVTPTVEVPQWATHAQIVATVTSAQVVTGQFIGTLAVEFDGQTGWAALIDINKTGAAADPERTQSVFAQWSAPLSDASRGESRTIAIKAAKTGGNGYLRADGYTQVSIAVSFLEQLK